MTIIFAKLQSIDNYKDLVDNHIEQKKIAIRSGNIHI